MSTLIVLRFISNVLLVVLMLDGDIYGGCGSSAIGNTIPGGGSGGCLYEIATN